jgi:dUTPase
MRIVSPDRASSTAAWIDSPGCTSTVAEPVASAVPAGIAVTIRPTATATVRPRVPQGRLVLAVLVVRMFALP